MRNIILCIDGRRIHKAIDYAIEITEHAMENLPPFMSKPYLKKFADEYTQLEGSSTLTYRRELRKEAEIVNEFKAKADSADVI
jgi:hypothetical protein